MQIRKQTLRVHYFRPVHRKMRRAQTHGSILPSFSLSRLPFVHNAVLFFTVSDTLADLTDSSARKTNQIFVLTLLIRSY